jgi:hypothetical protein
MIPGYLRTPSETKQARLKGLRLSLGIESSRRGGNHSRITPYPLFRRVDDRLPSVGHR